MPDQAEEQVDDSLLAHFDLPTLEDNGEGWGPASYDDNADNGIPFAPFNKNDRLGRISDWTQQGQNNRRGRGGRFPQQFGMGTGLFQYKHEDDESSFSLVDNRPKPKARFGRRPFRPNFNNRRGGWRGRGNWRGGWRGGRGGKGGKGRGGRNNWSYNNRYNNQDAVIKDPSVPISEEWTLLDTMDFGDLESASYPMRAKPESLAECGMLSAYDAAYDRVTPTPQKCKNLLRYQNVQHFTASTSDDPVIQKLVAEGAGNVYATDTILSVLMAATSSVNAWDVVVRKEGGNLFFDKRVNSMIDYLSVNENWNESVQTDKESVNHPLNLAREATRINHNFSQQVLQKTGQKKCKQENPFLKGLGPGMTAASCAFHYRRFPLGEGCNIVVRCGVNGFVKRDGSTLKMAVRALNEFDSKLSGYVDWRQKLETQTGAVLATEMKNNKAKLARWTAEIELMGAEEFRLGFVSRVNPKDNNKHAILMSKRFEPKAFARSIKVKASQLWGVLKTVVDNLRARPDGSYLLLKDPNKSELHVYQVPAGEFDNEHLED